MTNKKTKVKGEDTGAGYNVLTLDGKWLTSVTDAEQLEEYLRTNNMELINYDELCQD